MSTYKRNNNNRIFHIAQAIKVEGDFVLVLNPKGVPFWGEVRKISFRFNVLGQRVPVFEEVWIEEIGLLVKNDMKGWEIFTTRDI